MAKIAIVDQQDRIIGAADRAEARAKGLRHRIVRVFILNAAGNVLLQRRGLHLQDSPGKWDQSAGGHVDEGEDYRQAALREVAEELGITPTNLRHIGRFYTEHSVPGGFARRFHAVFVGQSDDPIRYDKTEVAAIGWFSVEEIAAWHTANPDDFTSNFAKAFALLRQALPADSSNAAKMTTE